MLVFLSGLTLETKFCNRIFFLRFIQCSVTIGLKFSSSKNLGINL